MLYSMRVRFSLYHTSACAVKLNFRVDNRLRWK